MTLRRILIAIAVLILLAIVAVIALPWIAGAVMGPEELVGQTPVRMTRLQSRGAVLKGYRTAFGLTQADVAQLSGVPAARVSRLERGLDSATAAEEVAIAAPLDSIFHARFDSGTESWLMGLTLRVRSQSK
jgi:hypothetical protein